MRGLLGSTVAAALACTTAACLGDAEVIAPDARDALFDLAAFVDYQDSVLTGASIRKRVRVGEESDETRVIDAVDWATELASFAGANVNKPALVDSYAQACSRDSGSGGGSTIRLSALDSADRVRTIKIACADQQSTCACDFASVVSIEVETRFESVIADTEQRLRWTREGYEVVSRQRVAGRDERVLTLEGEIVRHD